VTVEGPLYRFSFSQVGARLVSAELLEFSSFQRPGPVELVVEGGMGLLGSRIVVEADTIELRSAPFQVNPEEGLRLAAGGGPQAITFRYEHPTQPFAFEIEYTFDPNAYLVQARGRAEGLSRGLLLTDLGSGPAFNEIDQERDSTSLAYVVSHLQDGIRSTLFSDVESSAVEEGPLLWAAARSSYFVTGILPRDGPGDQEYLGGLLSLFDDDAGGRVALAATQSLGSGGTFEHRLYAGPQDYARLSALGNSFQDVNPVGWAWLRPVLRPIIAAIMWVLVFFHTNLAIGYGWVLILVGVLMRIVLFPLNHKAMRANLRNMAVQPLVKEIQTKYKDQPEKLQKEMVKLYKEHGFNPLAGCWPMLLPWPVLIALFFVFQNTIELRGVPFAWLPDLSTADPFYVLPVLLGVSMFLMQWISLRTMEEVNPQMKMMMWGMPIFMIVIFVNLPSGLNLYYLTANLATLPQTWWISKEREKMRSGGPPTPATA
jgi:YidC/Oxa1 family membrane protein insertase